MAEKKKKNINDVNVCIMAPEFCSAMFEPQ